MSNYIGKRVFYHCITCNKQFTLKRMNIQKVNGDAYCSIKCVPIKKGQMLGRLANGFQSDQGKLIHAVTERITKRKPCPYNDWGKSQEFEKIFVDKEVSLCGKKPGKRSVGWDFNIEKEINCEKCLKRIYEKK